MTREFGSIGSCCWMCGVEVRILADLDPYSFEDLDLSFWCKTCDVKWVGTERTTTNYVLQEDK